MYIFQTFIVNNLFAWTTEIHICSIFWFIKKLEFLNTYQRQYFYSPTPLSKTFDIRRIISIILNTCGNKQWIGGWGVWEICKTLLISTQKLYFGDGDAIYDVLMQVSVFKNDFITTDMKMIHLLNYKAFRHTWQIDRTSFAVRGPRSLNNTIQYKQNNIH